MYGIRAMSLGDLAYHHLLARKRGCLATAEACWRELLRRQEVKVDVRVELV